MRCPVAVSSAFSSRTREARSSHRPRCRRSPAQCDRRASRCAPPKVRVRADGSTASQSASQTRPSGCHDQRSADRPLPRRGAIRVRAVARYCWHRTGRRFLRTIGHRAMIVPKLARSLNTKSRLPIGPTKKNRRRNFSRRRRCCRRSSVTPRCAGGPAAPGSLRRASAQPAGTAAPPSRASGGRCPCVPTPGRPRPSSARAARAGAAR